MGKSQYNQDGFTLIEVIVTLVIISLFLTPLATSSGLFHRATAQADGETIAAMLAQSKMEELKGKPYNELSDDTDSFPNGYGYTVVVTTGALGTKTITVTVTYPVQDGTGQVKLQTERARR